MHYNVRVVLNNPIDPRFNFPESYLAHVIRTSREINIHIKNSRLYYNQKIKYNFNLSYI